MKAEYVSFNNSSKRQVIKESCEVLPDVGISIFSKAFVIEPVDLCDLLAFVVSSEDGDTAWVSYLKAY